MKEMPVDQIVALTQIPEQQVIRILREDQFKKGMSEIKKKVVKETFRDKVPILKEIVELSLSAIRDTLKELDTDEGRRALIQGTRDLQALSKVATDLNTLLRLELGESTANVVSISHSYQETRVAIQELQKMDPVFEYPEIPTPEKDNEF